MFGLAKRWPQSSPGADGVGLCTKPRAWVPPIPLFADDFLLVPARLALDFSNTPLPHHSTLPFPFECLPAVFICWAIDKDSHTVSHPEVYAGGFGALRLVLLRSWPPLLSAVLAGGRAGRLHSCDIPPFVGTPDASAARESDSHFHSIAECAAFLASNLGKRVCHVSPALLAVLETVPLPGAVVEQPDGGIMYGAGQSGAPPQGQYQPPTVAQV